MASDDGNGGASTDIRSSDPHTNARSRAGLSKRVSPGWSIGRANVVAGTTGGSLRCLRVQAPLSKPSVNRKPHAVFPFEPSLPSRPSATLLSPAFDPICHLPRIRRQASGYGNVRDHRGPARTKSFFIPSNGNFLMSRGIRNSTTTTFLRRTWAVGMNAVIFYYTVLSLLAYQQQ